MGGGENRRQDCLSAAGKDVVFCMGLLNMTVVVVTEATLTWRNSHGFPRVFQCASCCVVVAAAARCLSRGQRAPTPR
jgi:hypothetical protein